MARHYKGPKRTAGPKKPPLTHFLCLPLVNEASRSQLERSISAFCDQVSNADTYRISPKAIRPVGALHCTLGVMSLDAAKLAEAIDFLQSLSITSLLHQASISGSDDARPKKLETVPDADPLVVELRGLVSMHPPEKTSILYSEPQDPTDRLYDFCLALQNAFKERGFLIDDDRKLKLHATIVNTIYAKSRKPRSKKPDNSSANDAAPSPSNSTGYSAGPEKSNEDVDDRSHGHGPNANAPLKIDARALLEQYRDFFWAENVKLDRIAICEMGAKRVEDAEGNVVDERYLEVASVNLPT